MNQKEFSQKTVDEKLNLIFKSAEKTRKYFMWTLIITLVTFVLPLLILLVALPKIIGVYTSGLSGLGM